MQKFDGSEISVELPTKGDPQHSAESIFIAACRAISNEWNAAEPTSDKKRAQWLELVTYQCLSHLFDEGLVALIDDRLRGFKRYSRGNEGKANPFQSGILALFAHESLNRTPSEQLRSRVSKRLAYAYRHYVPYEFLRGFLHQVGDEGLGARIQSEEVEPGFEQWVVAKRLSDNKPSARGRYPSKIEDLVSGLRTMLPIIEEVEFRAASARTNRADWDT